MATLEKKDRNFSHQCTAPLVIADEATADVVMTEIAPAWDKHPEFAGESYYYNAARFAAGDEAIAFFLP